MSGFSDDGQWWWNGTQWIATSQVVLPNLPMTEFERSGRLAIARGRRTQSQWLFWANTYLPLGWLTTAGLMIFGSGVSMDYRSWTLEQLALATSYLLGLNEPMLAGEGGTLVADAERPPWKRDLAVVVTAAHVIVFRIDSLDGQPRWIALAARSTDVKIEKLTGIHTTSGGLEFGPGLVVTGSTGQWNIGCWWGSKPNLVLDAWRRATGATLHPA